MGKAARLRTGGHQRRPGGCTGRTGRWLLRYSGSWDTASRRSSTCGVWRSHEAKKNALLPWAVREHEEKPRSSDCAGACWGPRARGRLCPWLWTPIARPLDPRGPAWVCSLCRPLGLVSFSPASEVGSQDFRSGFSGSFQQTGPREELVKHSG